MELFHGGYIFPEVKILSLGASLRELVNFVQILCRFEPDLYDVIT